MFNFLFKTGFKFKLPNYNALNFNKNNPLNVFVILFFFKYFSNRNYTYLWTSVQIQITNISETKMFFVISH